MFYRCIILALVLQNSLCRSSVDRVDTFEDEIRSARVAVQDKESYIYAQCQVAVNSAIDTHPNHVIGTIDLRQTVGRAVSEIRLNLTGFAADDGEMYHGFHVHELGDLSNGCDSTGSHYNPLDVDHGAPHDSAFNRHIGDLGNIEEDLGGNCIRTITDTLVTLQGRFSVIGRALVIHETYDDLGRSGVDDSLTTGNAGARLSCCVIGLTDDQHWD
ncbi:hypothetical protein CAPTEDRAFT_148692 [Capitella teleta]|uniref:Superoxide dismutase [Cu-Zn] n=1 Tax=Capitella teleta TaxID=283909 RepID=R7U079_CAPTE|nr:hypothetical protein CAPTEDRAFT_148692 [Capitella teleta]|eukprot:ELT99613.1 hypothetical protein CAPTEDRAFT_148692 [Capitella teleta]